MLHKFKNIINNADSCLSIKKFLRYRQQICHFIMPFTWLDDRFFLEFNFFNVFNYELNYRDPQTFSEKIQWLKLYDRNTLYTQLVDKYAVRAYVENKVGSSYLNKLIGVYDNPDFIPWDEFPDKFVLKATHASRLNIICTNRAALDIEKLKMKLGHWLNYNYYAKSREWPYKDVKPKIICEALLEDDSIMGLLDYKIMCFNGVPRIIHVHAGRFTEHKVTYYDTDWCRQPFKLGAVPVIDQEIPKPKNLEEMLCIAKVLSSSIPFCSVDLYNVSEKIIFGEITFAPGGGFKPFLPDQYNRIIGDMITLPNIKVR